MNKCLDTKVPRVRKIKKTREKQIAFLETRVCSVPHSGNIFSFIERMQRSILLGIELAFNKRARALKYQIEDELDDQYDLMDLVKDISSPYVSRSVKKKDRRERVGVVDWLFSGCY